METAVANPISAGDTAWVLASSALVLLMTAPGLALFYGGMVRRKNVLGVLMQCFISLALISVLWVVYAYSLAFGKGSPFIGGLDWFMLNGVGQDPNPDYAATIPHLAFMIFQAMFAVITPALIIGSFAERMKFSSFLVFTTLWLTFVYCPIAHMVWGVGGFIRNLGALDFAGGTVVHMNAGIAGLVTALYLGKRVGGVDKPGMHNVPLVVIGASLLWFGWFGFNAGSALAANGLAANAFVTTNTATAAAALSWVLMEWIFAGKPTMVGAASGAVAGLVAITPACGFVDVGGSLWIGFLVSVICYFMVAFVKPKFGYDDTLDAFGIHAIGGFWGAMATGLFGTIVVNSAGADGLFHGNAAQVWKQFMACGITLVYDAIATLVICFAVDKVMGLRVSQGEETMGLDLTQHHERAYTILD
ncbi:MAG: ammonium transporter [Candidatus Omnitrophica bacterium]|nr:ammonium transporter [Candidatus Omnitrophota bacterium]